MAAKRCRLAAAEAAQRPSLPVLPQELWVMEIMGYLGRLGRSWSIRALSRLAQVCRAFRDSGWERQVTHLGGRVTDSLTDAVFQRFAPWVQSLVYHVPCHHCGDDRLHEHAFEQCRALHLDVRGSECYGAMTLATDLVLSHVRCLVMNEWAWHMFHDHVPLTKALLAGLQLVLARIYRTTFYAFMGGVLDIIGRESSLQDLTSLNKGYWDRELSELYQYRRVYRPPWAPPNDDYMPAGEHVVRWLDTDTGMAHSTTIVILNRPPLAHGRDTSSSADEEDA